MSGASLESVPPKTRRRFPASEKLRLVKAAEAAVASGERGALESLLRKEGIYSSPASVDAHAMRVIPLRSPPLTASVAP